MTKAELIQAIADGLTVPSEGNLTDKQINVAIDETIVVLNVLNPDKPNHPIVRG
jgi:nucleoid DNA-binding protein